MAGCTRRRTTPSTVAVPAVGEAQRAAGPKRRDEAGGGDGAGPAAHPATVGERRRQRRGEHRDEAQTGAAGQRGELDHVVGYRPAVADQVPREAGEQAATQPFGDDPGGGQAKDARDTRPAQPRRQCSEPGGDAEHRPGAEHREGNQRREPLGLDQHGVSEPVEPAGEVADAEPPAGGEGGAARRRGVDQPDQTDEGDDEQRQDVERRQGERRQGAEQGGRGPAAPADESGDACLVADHRYAAVSGVIREEPVRCGCANA